MFGNTPVPFTASWSAEERFHIAECRYFGRPAVFQDEQPGVGKPLFGKPHMQRQRQVIARCQCDLCGLSLLTSTKVSLSHARPQPHGASGWAVLQVEPMLHKRCAATSIRFCPSLRADVERGTLFVRQVTSHRVQCAILSEAAVLEFTGERRTALGHAKVELLRWIDRDAAWLEPDAEPRRRAAFPEQREAAPGGARA
ncbi:hypothetical protein [Sphingomonas sp. MMS24-J13]|uniref:hypothetical protein n=1 Tax=Sphingomonas sp. MMS24-J13 TaxID=3238686 RepID=UPI00384A89E6